MGHTKTNHNAEAIKLITREFKDAVERSHDLAECGNGPSECDLSGGILKRRKAAVLACMNAARTRYREKYPALDVDTEWARLCSTPFNSVNRFDEEDQFSLAAALWLLDALCENCSQADMDHYLPACDETFFLVTDFTEPRYDEATIGRALQLILGRDGSPTRKRRLISNAAANRQGPVEWRLPEEGKETLTSRERFNALMAMIPPAWIERASRNFEDKVWDYLDRYFACAAEYDRRERRIRDSAAQIEKECWQLHRESGGICPEDIPKYSVVAVSAAQILTPDQPGPLPFGHELNAGRIESLTKTWREKLAEADEIEMDHCGLREYSCLLPVLEGGTLQYWTDHYPPEIRQIIEGFTVDDPYEACFAYLCLVESGSDLPWLGAPALAVLTAAGAKLPWSAVKPGIPGLYELCYPDGEADINDPTAPEVKAGKAELYKLQYRPDIMPHPLDPQGPYRSVNMPQLAFRLSGLAMPRDVLDAGKVIQALVRAGVPAAEAPAWEQYMRLAREFHAREMYAEVSKLLHSSEEDASAEGKAAEDLSRQIQKLSGQLEGMRKALHDAERAVKAKQVELEQAKAEARNERQELIDLRELVFYQTSGQEPEPLPQQGVQFPCQVKQRTVVFGGCDNWLKAMRPLLPNVNFIRRDVSPNADLIRRADVVWVQTNYIAHSYYYKVAEIARNANVPIRYFTCTNAARCAERLVMADRKA